MTPFPASHLGSRNVTPSMRWLTNNVAIVRPLVLLPALVLLASAVLFSQSAPQSSPPASPQTSPKITGVEPEAGKVNDSITVSGANLAKENVAAIFLSDEKTDYKAIIVNQAADKIVMKVPQVKAGSYNVSIQVGNGILIEPVRFTVQ